MLSSGGVCTVETAQDVPDPADRVRPGGRRAGRVGIWAAEPASPNLLSFDMGGTTAKACIIDDGEPLTTSDFEVGRVYRFKKGSGLPIKVPVIEMIEIGAGGGSIARIDTLGLLKVGPDSAGRDARPGLLRPRRDQPTVTDADLVLGYLDPGLLPRRPDGARPRRRREAIGATVAEPLGTDCTRRGLGHPSGRQREHGQRGTHPRHRARQGPAQLPGLRLRRRRAGACLSRRARSCKRRG